MAIVKNIQADRLLKDAVVLDLGDLKRQASEIIAQAEAEAAAIIGRADAEAQRRIDESAGQGYDEGHRKGLEEGRETGHDQAREEALAEFRDRFDALDTKWTAALEQWNEQRRTMLLVAEEDVLSFAFVLARKLTYRIIEQDSATVIDQVRAALSLLSRPTAVSIRVHDDDYEAIDEFLPRLGEQLPACQHAELVRDTSVSRGGCIVKTAGGEIDASIDTQLDRIAETLLPHGRRLDGEAPR